MTSRAQSNVVGVALLVGVTMFSLGALTAGVGTVVEQNAAAASADRVAADLDDALRPVATTGHHEGRVSFVDGHLRTEERTVRVFKDDVLVAERSIRGLVFEADDHRVTFLAGGIVRQHGTGARFYAEPSVAVGEDVLILGIATAGGDGHVAYGGSERTTLRLVSDVSHDRRDLDRGEFAVAVETRTPGAWESYFERRGATVERRRFAADDGPSVVATFPGDRRGYLVVHDLALEVYRG